MNVFHISRRFYPCIGGTENYIYEISKRLVNKGINCRVFTLSYDVCDKTKKFKKYENIDNIEIFRIPGFGYYKKPIPLKIPIYLFKWADIVHIHDLRFLYETTLLLKSICKYKIVHSTHGFLLHTQDVKLIKSIMIPHYYKWTLKKYVKATICDSKQDYEYFKRWNLKNLYLIENGIDVEKFNIIEKKSEQGEFLYFGRIDSNKGLDLLFHTLAPIKDLNWRLNIIGDGSKTIIDELKYLSNKLNISDKIHWYGFLSENELFKLLLKSHLCFFPSRYEGFGFTLVEAMASGCVCVANEIPTYKSIIKNKDNGFLLNFSNFEESSEKIKVLLNRPIEKLSEVGKKAKETAKKYDWGEKIEQIIEVYKNCLK